MSDQIPAVVRVGGPASGDEPAAGSFAPDPEPLPAKTLLAGLADRLDRARSKLSFDLEIPRWTEQFGFSVWVSFAPLDPSAMVATFERFQKMKRKDWSIRANAQLLVDCCRSIYISDPLEPGKKLSFMPGDPDGDLTKFDSDLAEAIGVPTAEEGGSVIDTCLKMFFTEADLLGTVQVLAALSGQESEQADEAPLEQ